MSIARRVLAFTSAVAVLMILCPVPAGAGDCTPTVDAVLKDKKTDMGSNLRNFKFRVDVGQQGGSDCAAVSFALILHVQTAAGQEEVVRLSRKVKVRGSSIAMLVEHQISVDDNLASWEVAEVECHACAPGD